MKPLVPYLNFDNGESRAAMEFYQECLGGDLRIMTFAEGPMADKIAADKKGHVMHACLSGGPLTIMSSDMFDSEGLTKGNNVNIMIDCESEEEINRLFNSLSAGGNVTSPIKKEFWGAIFGHFTDKFGINWMLHYDIPKQ